MNFLIKAMIINLAIVWQAGAFEIPQSLTDSFIEGVHYKTLGTQKSAEPVVTEYFSVFCPHCKTFEPIIRHTKLILPVGTKFNRRHVSYMGGAMGPVMARVYSAIDLLDIDELIVPMLFGKIHDQRFVFENYQQVRDAIESNGIPSAQFDAAYNSVEAKQLTKLNIDAFNSTKLRGVPALVINNKYQLLPSGIQDANQYMVLLGYLLKK